MHIAFDLVLDDFAVKKNHSLDMSIINYEYDMLPRVIVDYMVSVLPYKWERGGGNLMLERVKILLVVVKLAGCSFELNQPLKHG